MTKATITRKMIEDAAALGLPVTAAAEKTGINVNTLWAKSRQFGIEFPRDRIGRFSRVSDEQMAELDGQGFTVSQAAQMLGYSEGYIRRRASEVGVKMGKKQQAPSADIRPAPPPKSWTKIKTIWPELARQAAKDNAAMRARCFNK